jgi:hypothetical protein
MRTRPGATWHGLSGPRKAVAQRGGVERGKIPINEGEPMHPTFERLLEPIRDKSLSIGERSFYAIREIKLTEQANEESRIRGDAHGLKFGENYLDALKKLIAEEGLAIDVRK